MQKLVPVEEARVLMNEAKDWSVWRWLTEKRRVRIAADNATDALNNLEREVKAAWTEDLNKAYRELVAEAAVDGHAKSRHRLEKAREEAKDIDPRVKLAVKRVKEADDVAEDTRLDAEATFAEAERRLSASMAREGAQRALDTYDLHEKAIRKAESLARRQFS
jgi:hypothetical protein